MSYSEILEALRGCVTYEYHCIRCPYHGRDEYEVSCADSLHNDAAASIEELQDTVQAQDKALKECARQLVNSTPKRGKWVGIEYDGYADENPVYDVWECSECGEEHEGEEDTLTNYCPNCGADMRAKMEAHE